MTVGFIVSCSECGKQITQVKDFDAESVTRLNKDLSKISDGFLGNEVHIETFKDMENVSRLFLLCGKSCNEQNLKSRIRKRWYEVISK